jgi:hypothetical protein
MTTKKKCLELASQNQITIEVYGETGNYSYSVDLPFNYRTEDFDGARKGLYAEGAKTAKILWQYIYNDIQTLINYKPWFKADAE